MRVISGRAKGRKLKMVPGGTTRPVIDRVKENLFNILGNWVIETRWLDLFAGTGQVGIEALSRNASAVVFIDNTKAAVRTIQDNLQITGLAANAEVRRSNAFDYLNVGSLLPFDVIYVAPPQYKGLWSAVLDLIDKAPARYLTTDGMVIVQIDPKEFEDLELRNLVVFDQRRYGRTMLCFYEVAPSIET